VLFGGGHSAELLPDRTDFRCRQRPCLYSIRTIQCWMLQICCTQEALLLLKAECYSPSANTSSKANNTYKYCYVIPVDFSSRQ